MGEPHGGQPLLFPVFSQLCLESVIGRLKVPVVSEVLSQQLVAGEPLPADLVLAVLLLLCAGHVILGGCQ